MINFPDNPTIDQIFSSGAASWKFDGSKWTVYHAPVTYLTLQKLSAAPAVAGAGVAYLYAIQGTGTSATLRVQAGTSATPVDLVVDVGGGF